MSTGTGLMTAGGTEVLLGDGEVVDLRGQPSALEALTKAEIDVQIATAKRFPRSPARFLEEARSMIAVSPDLAAQCRYKLPARKGGNGQPIEGPSVRLAEIVAVCWGNLRIAGRITDDDGRMLTAQGVAIDLERNVGYSVEARKGVTTREGRRFGDDMIRTASNALIAVATRNATFKAVPRAFVAILEEEAIAVARGDVRSLPDRIAKALNWLSGKGVTEAEVWKALEVKGPADLTLAHLETLNGYRTSINEGQATVEELFRPEPEAPASKKKGAEGLAERLGAKGAKPDAPAEEPRTREPGEDG